MDRNKDPRNPWGNWPVDPEIQSYLYNLSKRLDEKRQKDQERSRELLNRAANIAASAREARGAKPGLEGEAMVQGIVRQAPCCVLAIEVGTLCRDVEHPKWGCKS